MGGMSWQYRCRRYTAYRQLGDLCGDNATLIGRDSSTRDLLRQRAQHGEREARDTLRPVNSLAIPLFWSSARLRSWL